MSKSYEQLQNTARDINGILRYGRKRASNIKSGKLKITPELATKRRAKYITAKNNFIKRNKFDKTLDINTNSKQYLGIDMKPDFRSTYLLADFAKKTYKESFNKKVGKVLHEWKVGKLKTSYGKPVTSRAQGIAIALKS